MSTSREQPRVPYCMFIENVPLHADLKSASQWVLVSHHNEEMRFELAAGSQQSQREIIGSKVFLSLLIHCNHREFDCRLA